MSEYIFLFKNHSILDHSCDEMESKKKEFIARGGYDEYGSFLHYACREGYFIVAKTLIENGADINAKDKWDQTPLHSAVYSGFSKMVELLINNKDTIVDAVDEWGQTPLHYASEKGYLEIIKKLISKKADVNTIDNYGNTPLHYASEKGYLEIVKLLVEHGARLNSSNRRHYKPIDLTENEEIIKYLSSAKQMMDIRDVHSYFWVMVYNHPSNKRKNKN